MFPTRFTADEADRAADAWGCNCGPAALAAIMGLTLDQVRPAIPDFERKGYTNLVMMVAGLKRLGAPHAVETCGPTLTPWPRYGLCRVQWEGPWMQAPPRARAGKTHWIGVRKRGDAIGIFDINCIGNGSGWVSSADWRGIVAPFLTQAIRRADGGWHLTHAIEVRL